MQTALLSLKYKKALDLVAHLFDGVYRAGGSVPYLVHLVGVSHITRHVSDDESVHIAALLHDVLEDIDPRMYDEEKMRADFGDKITDIVKAVSQDTRTYTKPEAIRRYLIQLETGALEACLVSAADLLQNSLDMVELADVNVEALKERFGGMGAVSREKFITERYKILRSRLGTNHPIIADLQPILQKLTKIHSEIGVN